MRNSLGYDPTDQSSFPYQADDPPFGTHRLHLEDLTLEVAPDLDIMETIHEMTQYDDDGDSNYRMLDMALRLFHNLAADSAYEGIAHPELFAACCYQALIWERG
jgi:hypothetical protein